MNNFMKILSIELINFSRVYSGVGKTKIQLTFDNNNEMNLFVGNNGSGKSSIMGCIHPFAYNSAVGDNTTNSDIIIEGKDGKKTVVISYGMDIYKIQHVYTRKKDGTISVKSYIMKNDEELNDSGTVSTFKTIIFKELGINETFLTLLSIGNRINGFVEYTSGERKKYATKLFSELDIINEYYKKMTVKSRKMKTLLNNVTAKLSKYGNINKSELELQLQNIVNNIESLNNNRLFLMKEVGGIESQLKDLQDVSDKYTELQNRANTILEHINFNKSAKISGLTMSELETKKSSLTNTIKQLEIEIATIISKFESTSDTIDRLLNEKEIINSKISGVGTLEDVKDLEKIKVKLITRIDELSKKDYSKVANLSVDDLIRAGIYLDRAMEICSGLVFDTESEDNILDLFEKFKKDNSIYDKLEKRFNDADMKLKSKLSITSSMVDIVLPKIKCKPCDKCDDDNKCPYVTFYESFLEVVNQSSRETDMHIRKLREDVNNYNNDMIILNVIRQASQYIIDNLSNIKLPEGVFSPDTFINDFVENRNIYNKERLSYYVDLKQDQQELKDLKANLELTNIKLEKYNDIKKLISEYQTSLDNNIQEINKNKEVLDRLLNTRVTLEKRLNGDKFELDAIVKDINCQIAIDDLYKDLGSINNQVKDMQTKIEKIQSLTDRLNTIRLDISACMNKTATLETKKRELDITINDITNLNNEQMIISEDYDNIMAIQEAVSPTKGIPVEFIEFYMRHEMIDRMNDLLDAVYHGNFVLLKDKMVIDENEFRIPYRKRNTEVSDISKASDGERAILTITFSLVLIQLSLDKYNIMLLDEIDTSLDYNTRGKFLDLLERYMHIIGSHQLFLISHNNMFDEYPINLIMTSEQNISNMKKANVIKLY